MRQNPRKDRSSGSGPTVWRLLALAPRSFCAFSCPAFSQVQLLSWEWTVVCELLWLEGCKQRHFLRGAPSAPLSGKVRWRLTRHRARTAIGSAGAARRACGLYLLRSSGQLRGAAPQNRAWERTQCISTAPPMTKSRGMLRQSGESSKRKVGECGFEMR